MGKFQYLAFLRAEAKPWIYHPAPIKSLSLDVVITKHPLIYTILHLLIIKFFPR